MMWVLQTGFYCLVRINSFVWFSFHNFSDSELSMARSSQGMMAHIRLIHRETVSVCSEFAWLNKVFQQSQGTQSILKKGISAGDTLNRWRCRRKDSLEVRWEVSVLETHTAVPEDRGHHCLQKWNGSVHCWALNSTYRHRNVKAGQMPLENMASLGFELAC